jgi:para-aminobenzoate synthetase component 1
MNEYGRDSIPFFFMVDFDMQQPVVIPLSDIDDEILYNINGKKNYPEYDNSAEYTIKYKWQPYSKEKFAKQFDQVIKELNYGNSFLLNLAARHEFMTDAQLKGIFLLAKAKYKLLYKNQFVVFSPETFVQIREGKISSYPMKGTIDESIPNAEEIILADEKEKAEHNTIVDLIRNDLSMVATNVEVKKFRYIDLIESDKVNLLQVSTEIEGTLPDNYKSTLGDIIFKLLPAGSICGAPKKKTVEIINAVEEYRRSYYTGVAGIFDGENLDTFVMIRYIEKDGDEYYYRSGGGITARSDMENEYQEMVNKIYVPTA